MRMRFISILFLIVGVCSCGGESPKRVPNVSDTVDLYIDQLTNHYLDGQWKSENYSKIYHPNGNSLGIKMKFDVIKETIEDLKGDFLVSKAEVVDIKSDNVWVNYSKPRETKEQAYFVLLRFIAVAKKVKNTVEFYEEPKEIYQYLILASDSSDKKYKIIDFYPFVEDRRFIGIPYVLKMPNKFHFTEMELSQLKKAYFISK